MLPRPFPRLPRKVEPPRSAGLRRARDGEARRLQLRLRLPERALQLRHLRAGEKAADRGQWGSLDAEVRRAHPMCEDSSDLQQHVNEL